jgi:hypothetical protein
MDLEIKRLDVHQLIYHQKQEISVSPTITRQADVFLPTFANLSLAVANPSPTFIK